LEVAPTTTATCLPFEFALRSLLMDELSFFGVPKSAAP